MNLRCSIAAVSDTIPILGDHNLVAVTSPTLRVPAVLVSTCYKGNAQGLTTVSAVSPRRKKIESPRYLPSTQTPLGKCETAGHALQRASQRPVAVSSSRLATKAGQFIPNALVKRRGCTAKAAGASRKMGDKFCSRITSSIGPSRRASAHSLNRTFTATYTRALSTVFDTCIHLYIYICAHVCTNTCLSVLYLLVCSVQNYTQIQT